MTVQQGQILQYYNAQIEQGVLSDDVAQRNAITALDSLAFVNSPNTFLEKTKAN